jgi:hypothetical protein
MKKTVMTVHWLRVLAVMAPLPVFWLIVLGSPVTHGVWVLLVLLAFSILVGAVRIGWGRMTRSMADVIDDVEGEAPPIAVRATNAVSTLRRDRGRP